MAAGWLSITLNWQVVFLLILVWYVLLKSWERSGKLDHWNSTRVFGLILMMRTSAGKKTLETVSKPRGFWRMYGEVSLWVCWGAMFIVAIMLAATFVMSIIAPPTDNPPSASELMAIPGLNPVIPLGWGVIAFVICLVIHEFGHGLQARAHGMRVRSFGLLMLGPLPLGAFAEPEYAEITQAPKRERQRMFAAGPATNLFAAFFCCLLMGLVAGQIVSAQPGVHASGIVVGEAAENAGLEPLDVILKIDNNTVETLDDFRNVMDIYSANDTVFIEVLRTDGTMEELNVTFGDQYSHYLSNGWSEENLEAVGIEPGDAFLGVQNIAEGTAGIDRIAGPFSPRHEGSGFSLLIDVPLYILNILVTPFLNKGVAINPIQENMLSNGEGFFGSLLGIEGLLFLANLFFWLIWVNILLGFTNLIPMIPFDGGHLFKDLVHSFMNGIKKLGEKSGAWKLHPLWVDHISNRASSLSSLGLLMMLLFIMFIPYF
jgi:membrane-associated protease RseP (regulator of RpoE activity)